MPFFLRTAFAICTLGLCVLISASAQGPGPKEAKPAPRPAGPPNPLIGTWTYRSFRSDSNSSTQPNDLLFGQGTLEFSVATPDRVAGTIGAEGWQLNLTGRVES